MSTQQANNSSNTGEDPRQRAQLVFKHTEFGEVTNDILKGNEAAKPPKSWWVALAISFSLMSMLGILIGYLFVTGVGVWGNNNPVMWGYPIVNFVFWVGISHAGVMISAILRLSQAEWRRPMVRAAETMTVFSLMASLVMPLTALSSDATSMVRLADRRDGISS